MYRDSEMVIWFARGPRPVALPAARCSASPGRCSLVVAVLALVVWPWANQQTQELRDRYGKRGDLERVAPGQFQESASGKRVFFLDKDTPDNKSGKNIFISTNERGKETVTSARSGRIETDGRRASSWCCPTGQRIETRVNGDADCKISEFEELRQSRRRPASSAAQRRRARQDAVRRSTLMMDPTPPNLGELAWRLGLALARAQLRA